MSDQKTSIIIEFTGTNSTLFDLNFVGQVDFYQLLIAGEQLTTMAKDEILKMKRRVEMQAQAERIQTPNPGLIIPKGKMS